MNSSNATGENGNVNTIVNSSTPSTSTTTLGTEKKSIDDPSAPPPLPHRIKRRQTSAYEFTSLSPDQVNRLNRLAGSDTHTLRKGCYSIDFSTGGKKQFEGTLRVHAKPGEYIEASGDLYHRDGKRNDRDGMPVFALKNYRYYLRVTKVSESVPFLKAVNISFEMWRFNGASATPMWSTEGLFSAEMVWSPSGDKDLEGGATLLKGLVKNSSEEEVGEITMRWVSKFLRSATIEIDTVKSVNPPYYNKDLQTDWQTVFTGVDWKIDAFVGSNNIKPPNGPSWSEGELHEAMLLQRDKSNLDEEWRFHVLVVDLIDTAERGIMYDASGTDSNKIPREGIGIAYKWKFTDDEHWGVLKNQCFGDAGLPYFRTALHEIGHAMGLFHNDLDNGIMNTTDSIAKAATDKDPFPQNISLTFNADDRKRLRHMPDIFVRPGGIPFGAAYSVHPLSIGEEQERAAGVDLIVTPVEDVLPIGAPVRLNLKLNGNSNDPVPGSLNMKVGFVKGKVIDPSGNVRTFSPLIVCVDEVPLKTLGPDGISDSLTLLRGVEGALFSASGPYSIQVEVSWDFDKRQLGVTGSANVFIMPAVDADHARAAMTILSTPDTLLSLVMSGDHNDAGNKAIEQAFQNPVLKRHYAYLELRRSLQSKNRHQSITPAILGMENQPVMSIAELEKAIKLILNVDLSSPNLSKASAPGAMDSSGTTAEEEIARLEKLIAELQALISEATGLFKDQVIQPKTKVVSPGSKDEIDSLLKLARILMEQYKQLTGQQTIVSENTEESNMTYETAASISEKNEQSNAIYQSAPGSPTMEKPQPAKKS